ncbi:unnamed protein product [Echinostoma caproni]|uniref:DC_STAMP domain-containing protein n=1 Tax=Echinostoma caproni TaxID=27848 RepID=A0A183AD13_9TREM|nr:unnamed protein product [Echinostoma caproni]
MENRRLDILHLFSSHKQHVCGERFSFLPFRTSKTVVPFLETVPPTALLYFGTRDAMQLMERGQQRLYTDIHPGPHPDHDLITLHRHGHAFGGLPWLFWISLGLLITLFHLFFCKIIYNELWKENSDTEDKWHLPRFATDLRTPESIKARPDTVHEVTILQSMG